MRSDSSVKDWIVDLRNQGESGRLFCFPYAGGGAQIFNAWRELVREDISLHAIQPPGRGKRLFDPPVLDLETAVEAIVEAIGPMLDLPFFFFGHSMGALVAFEVARALRRKTMVLPRRLFLSAYGAPQFKRSRKAIHGLPDNEFTEAVKALEGTPHDVFENPELLSLILPALRADFALVECYQHRFEEPLPTPIVAFCGMRDAYVDREAMEGWQFQTSLFAGVHMMPGGHFFIHEALPSLASKIAEGVRQTFDHGGRSNIPQPSL
jgi:medium-chain acyl-[acyl-carrier-protein] hydrolase